MFSFIAGLNPKVYLVASLFFVIVTVGGYIKYLQSNLEEVKNDNAQKTQTIKDKDEDIKNIIDGYEETIILREKLATEKAITQEQKEVVVTKYKTLIKEVEKRGDIKQDEKSNFTIVTF